MNYGPMDAVGNKLSPPKMTTTEINERETIHAKPLVNGVWLESEVKIENLQYENIAISVSYVGGHACLTGRVACFEGYCWVGHGDNGLTLPNGTILERIGIAPRDNDYSQGYKFRVNLK